MRAVKKAVKPIGARQKAVAGPGSLSNRSSGPQAVGSVKKKVKPIVGGGAQGSGQGSFMWTSFA